MARVRGQAGGIGRRRLMGMTLATGLGVGGSLLPGLERLSVGLLQAAGSGAVERLEAAAAAYLAAEQALTAVEGSWAIARRTLGLSLVIAPAEGSHGPLGLGQPPAVLTAEVDSAALAATLATLPALGRPPVEARLLLDGATVTVSPEAPGRRLDLTALANVLEERARLLDDSPVALPLVEQPPTTTASALAPVADWLRRVLARPLLLAGTPGPAAIPPGAIAAALRVEPTGSVRPDPVAWERLLASMAGSVAVAPTEPVLILAPERAEIVPARLGQVLDVPATAAVAWQALRASQAEVWPVFRPVAPARSADDLAPVAALASRLLAQPPVLVAGAVEWPLAPADLARLLRPADQGLDVDSAAAGEVIRVFAARAAVAPQPPLYRWREGRVEADGPGRPGWQLDREAALAVLRDGLLRGQDRLVLPLVEAPPVAPEGLAFPDLLAEGRTYFADSVRERYTNVALGLTRINGALVPPGGEFSFNAASGPVTFAAGFKRGYGIAISNGKVTTLPSVGGGICQVATTVFHAAFHAGLPIGQRSWHLYWMPRYGRPPSGLTGLDATVDDQSSLDFTFFNTTGQWLLVEAVVEGGYAVVRLRGASPGWRVAVAGPFISNIVRANPTMTERPEPTLPKGSRVWVEHAEDGKTVAIKRTIHDDLGQLLERRTFTARYAPAANVTLVGTG